MPTKKATTIAKKPATAKKPASKTKPAEKPAKPKPASKAAPEPKKAAPKAEAKAPKAVKAAKVVKPTKPIPKAVPKQETPKQETPKQETPKQETPKKAAPKKAAPKAAPKAEAKAPKAAKAAKATKPVPKATPKQETPKKATTKVESVLMISGAKFYKSPFFFDAEKEYGNKYQQGIHQKLPDKPTASSRLKVGGPLDGKNLVEILSQQLEYENKVYFEGCEGQICVKCNKSAVDPKYYVDKSLGYCTECAELLSLGQSKEGVFSDAQMELMRRSIEKSMENAKDIDEDDLESTLGDFEEQEEALLAIVEEAELNA